MHFGEIPEEAKFVVFTEDGNAQYVKEFNLSTDTFTVAFPTNTLVTAWEDIEVGIEE